MALEPITRTEQIMSGKSLTPITREEMFLAKAGGQDVQVPTPVTRKEMFLQKIAENGGGTGGGSGGDNNGIDALIDGSITEVRSNASLIKDYTFNGRSALTTADFPMATSVGMSAFSNCGALVEINFLSLSKLSGSYAFQQCPLLESVSAPSLLTISSAYAFDGDTSLKVLDFNLLQSLSGNGLVRGCTSLKAIILRNTLVPCALSSTTTFTSSTIAFGTCYIYVPAALVDRYKAATNWSTYAAQFRALEDYTVDGTTTGALDESKI